MLQMSPSGPLSQSPIQLENCWGARNYASVPIVLSHGRGCALWDAEGRRYLDFMGAYSASNLGHCHPRIVAALARQAETLDVVSRAFYSDRLGALLERACDTFGFERALPMNTGAEGIETAIKAARKWAYDVKGVPTEQAELIVCANNFHGRTLGAISMSSSTEIRGGFGPCAPGFKVIPFDDVGALSDAITERTAAFVVEPIQGEAGIVVPATGYLQRCAEICRRQNVLLITDEIQTGLGRTGPMLASTGFGVHPDAVVIGKSLGGGVMPVSMLLGRKEVMDVFTPGTHGSTFGGFPIAAAVALEALSVIEDEDLCRRSAVTGAAFKQALRSVVSPHVKEVRGVGLMLAVETDPARLPAPCLADRMRARGILCKNVNDRVIRLAPPLAVGSEQIDAFMTAYRDALDED